MGLVLFGISVSMLSGIAIKKAVEASKDKLYKEIGAGFTVSNNIMYNMGTSRGGGTVPGEMLDQLEKLQEVTKSSRRMLGVVQLHNAEKVPLSGNPFGEEYIDVADMMGISESDLDSRFVSGALKLTKGRHLQKKDKNKILLHETFAEKNHLKVGDMLEFSASKSDRDNINPAKGTFKGEIVGLFSGKNVREPNMMEEMSENIIFADLHTIRTLYHYTDENEIYQDASFFTENPKTLEEAMKKAENLPLDWKNYKMEANGSEYAALSRSVEGMNRLVGILLAGAFLAGVVILSLVLFLWIQGRTKETGIMMALGISKGEILVQYTLELLLISIISFTLAFFAGNKVAQSVGDRFVQQASDDAVRSVDNEAMGMLGADLESTSLIKTIDKIDVNVSVNDMVIVCGLGVLVILSSVCISSAPVIRMKPKEILSQMS